MTVVFPEWGVGAGLAGSRMPSNAPSMLRLAQRTKDGALARADRPDQSIYLAMRINGFDERLDHLFAMARRARLI